MGAELRNAVNVFKQIGCGDGLKKDMLYYSQHQPLLTP
jgi:hypothetical protein